MTSRKSPRPVIDAEKAPWISLSKDKYTALQHEELGLSIEEELLSWLWIHYPLLCSSDRSSKIGNDDAGVGLDDGQATRKCNLEISTPPEPVEVPSDQVDPSKSSPQSNDVPQITPSPASRHSRTPSHSRMNGSQGFTVEVTRPVNFSRPLRRPPLSTATPKETESHSKKHKSRRNGLIERLRYIIRCMIDKPKFDEPNVLQPHHSIQPTVRRDLTDQGYDPRDTPKPPDLHDVQQPLGELPVETLRPPGRKPRKLRKRTRKTDRVPKHQLRPPEPTQREVARPLGHFPTEPKHLHISRFHENLPPVDLAVSQSNLDFFPKLMGKPKRLRRAINTTSPSEVPPLPRSQVKGGARQDSVTSLYSTIKRSLKSFTASKSRGQEDDSQYRASLSSAPIPKCDSKNSTPSLYQDRVSSSHTQPRVVEKDSRSSIAFTENTDTYNIPSVDVPRGPSLMVNDSGAFLSSFQCTFCRCDCSGREEWLEHEKSAHLERDVQSSMPNEPMDDTDDQVSPSASSHASSARRMLRKLRASWTPRGKNAKAARNPDLPSHPGHWKDNWYWNCGFCGNILRSWDERQNHLAVEHFSQGQTMRDWDPGKSPYPWSRTCTAPNRAPSLHLTSVQPMPQPAHIGSTNSSGDLPNEGYLCTACQISFQTSCELTRHTELWHSSRTTWTCPILPATSNLTDFFDAIDHEDGSTDDICYACGEWLPRPCYMDFDTRMRHLRKAHNYGESACLEACFNKDQFLLHLANAHYVRLPCIKGVMDFCKADRNVEVSMENAKEEV